MTSQERRNELDESKTADLEYLVYGKFGVKEKDKGYWDTRWCALADLFDQQQVG